MIGTTSYGFRYRLMDERLAPPLERIVDETKAMSLECLQICDNARPLALADGRWSRLLEHARGIGLALELGCVTVRVPVLQRYLERAAEIPSGTLRIVLEEDTPTSRGELAAFLEHAARAAERAGACLPIENHFHVPCRLLAELAEQYPGDRVTFCLDTANSLRNFEPAEQTAATWVSRWPALRLEPVSSTFTPFCNASWSAIPRRRFSWRIGSRPAAIATRISPPAAAGLRNRSGTGGA